MCDYMPLYCTPLNVWTQSDWLLPTHGMVDGCAPGRACESAGRDSGGGVNV